MNIVFLLRPWPVYGGGETVTVALANELAKRRHSVHVLYTRPVHDKPLPFIHRNVESRLVPGLTADEHHDFSPADSLKANAFLRDYITRNDIHVVIDQWWSIESLRAIKGKCLVIKCMHTSLFLPCEFENVRWRGVKGALIKLAGKAIYDRYKKEKACRNVERYFPLVHKFVFLAGSFLRDYVQYRKTADVSMFDFCNNPLPYDEFIPEDEFPAKEDMVLFVGRMYDNIKKVSLILDCWRQVESHAELSSWKLVLCGDGPDKEALERQARRMGLKNYEFTGYRQPKPYYRKAKIFVMASTHEGWPMTLMESLQNGVVPVVRDTYSSLHDIITDGTDGLIVPPESEEEFVKALSGLMCDEKKLSLMAREGLKSCRRFSVENIVDKWERIFKHALIQYFPQRIDVAMGNAPESPLCRG